MLSPRNLKHLKQTSGTVWRAFAEANGAEASKLLDDAVKERIHEFVEDLISYLITPTVHDGWVSYRNALGVVCFADFEFDSILGADDPSLGSILPNMHPMPTPDPHDYHPFRRLLRETIMYRAGIFRDFANKFTAEQRQNIRKQSENNILIMKQWMYENNPDCISVWKIAEKSVIPNTFPLGTQIKMSRKLSKNIFRESSLLNLGHRSRCVRIEESTNGIFKLSVE